MPNTHHVISNLVLVSLRIYLPRRMLTVTNCSFGNDDYCELGSRFKASHIRLMVWWIATKVQELTQNSVS